MYDWSRLSQKPLVYLAPDFSGRELNSKRCSSREMLVLSDGSR